MPLPSRLSPILEQARSAIIESVQSAEDFLQFFIEQQFETMYTEEQLSAVLNAKAHKVTYHRRAVHGNFKVLF